jgi:ribosomal protein S15P/S13E
MEEEVKEVDAVETTDQQVEQEQQETVEQTKEEVVEESSENTLPEGVTTVKEDGTIKVDFTKLNQEEDAVQEQETTSVDVGEQTTDSEKVDGEVRAAEENEEQVLELVQEENVEQPTLAEKINNIPEKLKQEQEDVTNNQEDMSLPENIEKLVDFMKETGGTLEDYVKLNKDYSGMSDNDILREYYRQTKPHLNEEEVSFLMEDNFSYDESIDDERDIKRKKLNLKESIAEAKSHLNSLKGKYYDELKLSSKLTPEQKEAVSFYEDYKKEETLNQELAQKTRSVFEDKTNELFNNDFKGFDFKVGDNRYRYKVKDVNSVRENQVDINTFVNKFVDENKMMSDAAGYHKALFTAMNADNIANHFYEQGKADALKQQMAKSKNIDLDPRGKHEGVTTSSGIKVRAVSGQDTSKLRIKIRE